MQFSITFWGRRLGEQTTTHEFFEATLKVIGDMTNLSRNPLVVDRVLNLGQQLYVYGICIENFQGRVVT